MSSKWFTLATILGGVACIVGSSFAPADAREYVLSAGTFLLGWVLRRPGDVTLTEVSK